MPDDSTDTLPPLPTPSIGQDIVYPQPEFPAPSGPSPRLVRPAETFDSPAYLKRVEDAQMEIYKRARNVQQAEQDVSAARRMLGILKADREIQSGVPVDQAMYRNLQYFVNPADKNFAAPFKALQPPRPPTPLNMPGLPAGVVDARGVPHWPSAAAVKANAPPVEYLPKEVEIGGEKWLVNTHTGHFERKDKGKVAAVMTPAQMQQGLIAQGHIVEKQLAAVNVDSKTRAALQTELNDIKTELIKFRQPTPTPNPPAKAPPTERVRVKSPDGKTGTVSRSKLEQAIKAGYSVVDGAD